MALANRKIGYDEVVTRDIHFPMNVNNVARHWLNNDGPSATGQAR